MGSIKLNIGLPHKYPAAANLPLNQTNLESSFQISAPDKDPGTPGVWLILQGSSIWVEIVGNTPVLPNGAITMQANNKKPLYIGTWQGLPCRVIELAPTAKSPQNLFKINLMDRNPLLQLPLFSLAGIGMMTSHWNNNSRYCGQCGESLVQMEQKMLIVQQKSL